MFFRKKKSGFALDKWKNLSDEDFIGQLYLTALQRNADRGGEKYYLAQLHKGVGRAHVVYEICNSEEAKQLQMAGRFDVALADFVSGDILGLRNDIRLKKDDIPQILNSIERKFSTLNDNIVRLADAARERGSDLSPGALAQLLSQRVNQSSLALQGSVNEMLPSGRKYRIIIDMQGAQAASRDRGIGRYTMSLVHSIIDQADNYEVFLSLNRSFPDTLTSIKQKFLSLLPEQNFLEWSPVGPTVGDTPERIQNRAASEAEYEQFLISHQPDFVLISNMFESHGFSDDAVTRVELLKKAGVKVACILYDLIPLISPERHLSATYVADWYYEKLRYLQNTDLLLAISESAQLEGQTYLDLPKDRVVNISSAVSDEYKVLDSQDESIQDVKEKFELDKPFIMHTAGMDERKNVRGLMQAYALLPDGLKKEYDLVIVFDLPPNLREDLLGFAEKLNISKHLKLTGFVTNQELIALYNICTLFVFPSLHEGFGLPVLEAMSCGCPAIASNTSSLPEVVGCDDYLFDPTDSQSIKNKIVELLSNNEALQQAQKHAHRQMEQFSWDKSAAVAVSAMQLVSRLERKNKTLWLDISELAQTDAKSGIQRVVRALINEFLLNPPNGFDVKLIYATQDNPEYRHATGFLARTMKIRLPDMSEPPADFKRGDVFYGVDFCPGIQANRGGFYKELRESGVEVVFLVHDLIPVLHPEWWTNNRADQKGVIAGFEKWLNAVREGSGVICVSDYTKEWFKKWILENSFESQRRDYFISYAHNGADIANSSPSYGVPENWDVLKAELQNASNFIMVGTIEPRKGHADVLDCFDQLWQQGNKANLLIVGKTGWLVDGLIERIQSHPMLNRHLFLFQAISDEFLEQLYQISDGLIAASYDEGFGLPLIEAAQNKCEIIARDIPIFREVAGDSATYFDTDKNRLDKVIVDWLAEKAHKPHNKVTSMKWLTWAESANRHKAILAEKIFREQIRINEIICYWLNNTRLGTEIGTVSLTGLHTTETEGMLLFGPYLPLPEGHWKIVVSLGQGFISHAKIDVVSDGANTVWGEESCAALDLKSKTEIEFYFSNDQPIADLEVRIRVDALSDFSVERVSVVRVK